MALKKCKECGNEISTKAKECPHCGNVLKKKLGCGCTTLVVVGLFLLIVGSLVSNESKTTAPNKSVDTSKPAAKTVPKSTWKNQDNSLMAYIMMEGFVKKRLKSPSSADFPGIFDGKAGHIKRLGGYKYLIASWVDSQNAFGAMIRTQFIGEIEQVSEDDWQLIALQFVQ